MDLKRPKITVITPLYNRADFIEETIKSILSQSYSDFEYLILDDGSTDNGKKIVEKFLQDPRVKYYYFENSGEAVTVNRSWKLARGEYFTQVNSDDPILPGLFRDMVVNLDKRTDAVVAYPDFYFIDKDGKRFKEVKSPDWVFLEALSDYSCYASSPGAFIRKDAFSDWENIKDKRFRHISDNYMYFNMALKGPFLHIPKFLATWRQHAAGISANRYESIPEIEIWYQEYFSQANLPVNVLECQWETKKSMYAYFIRLLEESNLKDKEKQIEGYLKKMGKIYKYQNLQVGDNDLVGNKFNGHDLHLYLRKNGIDSKHLVWNKESDDPNTFLIAADRPNRQKIREYNMEIQKDYSLDNILGSIAYDVLYNKLFLDADIVHYHLIHNLNFDIQLLPILTRLKPTVWTLHDPWAFSGHCILSFGCERWKTGCGDCPYLNIPFKIKNDNTALNYELKKNAIQNSKLDVIVASKHMESKIKQSEIFKNARIHRIPFGIDQEIFRPLDKREIRKKFNIPEEALVIFFRNDNFERKGIDYIYYALKRIKTRRQVYVITVSSKMGKAPKGIRLKEFGWVKDDYLLAQIYNASDLYLMPSIVESFGLMAVEAMCCAVLPIVLEGTALPEVTNAPLCGVVSEHNKDKFTELVQYYLDHDSERLDRAKKCYMFAKTEYNKENYVKRILEVYKIAMQDHHINKTDMVILNQLKKYMLVEPSSGKLNNVSIKDDLVSKRDLKYYTKKTIIKILDYFPDYRKIKKIESDAARYNSKLDELSQKLDRILDGAK